MSTKNIAGLVLAMSVVMAGVTVTAKEGANTELRAVKVTTRPTPSPANVACIAAAVSSRERTLGIAVSANTSAIQSAYSARASALAAAYTKTATADIRTGVKEAWSNFNTSIRTAGKNWKTAQTSAWSAFKSASRACKDTSGLSDGDNSLKEVSGQ